MTSACPRECDVTEAVLAGRWDDPHCDQLRTHATHCAACGDLAWIATILREDRDALKGAHLPAAGQVWWRAAIRARLEDGQSAVRPLVWLYGVVGAGALGLALAFGGSSWSWLQPAFAWVDAASAAVILRPFGTALGEGVRQMLPLAVGAAVAIVLLPLTLFLVLSDD